MPPSDDDAAEMPSADDIYAVQVIWDETMADTAAKWLAAHPDGHILILAGTGTATTPRSSAAWCGAASPNVVSVRTVSDNDVSDALVAPINDFLVVLRMPAAH